MLFMSNNSGGSSLKSNNFSEMRIEDITKTYEKEGSSQTVLEGCSLLVEREKLTVLMGPSGCGKTVLINLLAGYEKPTSGKIFIDNEPVTGPGPDRLVVFQETTLFPWMSVYSNVIFG